MIGKPIICPLFCAVCIIHLAVFAGTQCIASTFPIDTLPADKAVFAQPSEGDQSESDVAVLDSPEQQTLRPANLPEGINDGFLDPDMDPEDYLKRFEIESREVFACRAQIMDALEIQPGMSVADIGAGTGLFMNALSQSVCEHGRVYAVEISPSFVKHLRSRAKSEGLENVEVVFCSDRNVNLPRNSVDRLFLCDVYHHFEYPGLTLESMHQALRDDGMLIVIDFYREPEGVSPERVEWLKGHVRAPKKVFRQEIEDAGFKFLDEVPVEGFLENYLLRFVKHRDDP